MIHQQPCHLRPALGSAYSAASHGHGPAAAPDGASGVRLSRGDGQGPLHSLQASPVL